MQEFLQTTIRAAGALAKSYFDAGVSHTIKKNLGDLLTEADTAVSTFLVSEIQKQYPDHHIHSEEMAEDINPGAEYEWVIDPIDGTRNFAHGIPIWCQLVCILKNGEPYMAAIYNAPYDQLFFAEKGKGATLNGRQIRVNTVDSLEHGFGFFGRWEGEDSDKVVEYKQFVTRCVNDTSVWLHAWGTMLAACSVASGGADFFVSNTGYDHDNLAPALICQEAGAVVTDSEGNPWTRQRRDIMIANPKLHPKIMELFQ